MGNERRGCSTTVRKLALFLRGRRVGSWPFSPAGLMRGLSRPMLERPLLVRFTGFSQAFPKLDRHYSDFAAEIELQSKCNLSGKLLKVLEQMDISQISRLPTLIIVFQTLGRSGNHKASLDSLSHLKLKGYPREKLAELVTAYAEGLTKRVKDSRQLKEDVEGFKTISVSLNLRPSASFNLLIVYCCSHGEIDLCIDLIKTMKEGGMELSAATYEPLVIFYARTLEIAKAEHILTAMRSSGMLVTSKAYRFLIQAYTVSGNFEKAFNVIEDVSSLGITPTPAMYNPIIYAYAMKGNFRKSFELLRKMERLAIGPNGDNFASLIHACASRNDSKVAASVFRMFDSINNHSADDCKKVVAAMMRVYASCGDLKQAQEILTNKKYSGLGDTVEAKSAVLSGLSRTSQIEEAVNVFEDMRRTGASPLSCSFLSLLNAVGIAGRLDQLLVLFELFRKSIKAKTQVQQEEQISTACVIVVLSFIRHNELGKAVEFLEKVQMENIGDAETLCLQVFQLDVRQHTLQENVVQLTLDDKFKFVETMHKKLKLPPSRIALEALLESCAKEKDVHRAKYVVQMMKHANLRLNIFTYLILLRTVVSAGEQAEAKETTMEMKIEMEHNGLQDADVRRIISKILQKSEIHDSSSLWRKELLDTLYPPNTDRKLKVSTKNATQFTSSDS